MVCKGSNPSEVSFDTFTMLPHLEPVSNLFESASKHSAQEGYVESVPDVGWIPFAGQIHKARDDEATEEVFQLILQE